MFKKKLKVPVMMARVVMKRKIMSHFLKCSTEGSDQKVKGDGSKEEW